MAKSKYGFKTLKRDPAGGKPPAGSPARESSRGRAGGSGARTPRAPDPLDVDREIALAHRDDDPDQGIVSEEESYGAIAARAPVLHVPGRASAIRLFRQRVREMCLVDPLILGSSEDSIEEFWLKGRGSDVSVEAAVRAYIAYLGLAIIRSPVAK